MTTDLNQSVDQSML